MSLKQTSAERPIRSGRDTRTDASTLRTLVEERARTAPDAPFVIFDDLEGGVSMRTYREFAGDVNRTARLLGDLGIRRGDRVALLLANCPEFLDLWFGAAAIGAVIVPVNTASSAAELEYLAGHSDSRLIFTQAPCLETAEAVARRCPNVESVVVCGPGARSPETSFTGLAAARADAPPPGPPPGPTDDAAILYTSGTTARPKGVLVTHANYLYAGRTVANAIRLTPDHRHLVVLPFFHGNAQYYSTMSTLVAGASMAMTARFSASRYFDQAIAHRCTASSLFAAPIRMLLAQPRRPRARVESVAGGAVRAERHAGAARRMARTVRTAAAAAVGHDGDDGTADHEPRRRRTAQHVHGADRRRLRDRPRQRRRAAGAAR